MRVMFRKLRLGWMIVYEFKLAILMLACMVLGGGFLIHISKKLDMSDAMFAAFAASFFEFVVQPPFPWYLQVFLYLAPLVGVLVIADSVVIFATLLFGKRQKLQKWWEMIASTYSDHVVVCGVGKVGYRVINELRKLGVLVVGIENNLEHSLVQELLDEKIPIIHGDIRLRSVLERANVEQARAVICVTNDDLANLDCAFTVREIRDDLRVVVRLFDDNIAKKMSNQFDLPALSTSYASAPSFVSEALRMGLSQTQLSVYGQAGRINTLKATELMIGKTIAEIEDNQRIKVLGYKDPSGREHFPGPSLKVEEGGQLVMLRTQRE